MKKLLTVLFSLSMVACILLTGCGKSDNPAQAMIDKEKEALEQLKEEVEAEGLFIMDVIARDKDTLVYTYKLAIDDIEMDVALIESELEKQADLFMQTVEELEKKGAEEAKVVIEYLDSAGEEIHTKIFQK